MKLAIIDYGSGNLHSAAKAFERANTQEGVGAQVEVTADADKVSRADAVVLPGVGAFADCKAGLVKVPGMIAALEEAVLKKGRPFLGICVGMQLMAQKGFEHGTYDGLGWIEGSVKAIEPTDPTLKIPHMGWNELTDVRPHPVTEGLGTPPTDHAYFVHSYHFIPEHPDRILARTDYGEPLAAIIGRDNMVGTQFHPEKSQATGLRLIANFLKWRP